MATDRLTFADRARGVVERFSFRNLTFAVVLAALFAAGAAVLSLRAEEQYEARAVLVIDNPLALARSGDDGTINKLDKLRNKYATLAATDAIAGPVGDGLGASPRAVIRNTEVFAGPATLSLVVTGRAGTSEVAVARATTMAQGIIDYVEAEHEANSVPQENRFYFTVAQPAEFAVQTSPSSERAREAAILAFVVSLLAAYVVLQLVRAPVVVPEPDDEPALR